MTTTPERLISQDVNYGDMIDQVTSNINQITKALDTEDLKDDEEAKNKGKEIIKNFREGFDRKLIEYFKDKPEKINELKTAIIRAIDNLKSKNNNNLPEDYKPLEDLLNQINSTFLTINTEDASHTVTVVDLSLNEDVKLDGIEEGEESEREKKFFKGIDETDGQSLSKLEETIKDIKEQNDIIAAITAIGASKIPGEIMEKVKGLKNLFANINNVINNTSLNNVQILQSYIFNNLDANDQKKFKDSNKYNKTTNKFDGKFGESTLDGLNKVLEKTRTYLKDVNKKFGSVENPKYAEVKANENVNIQLNGVIDPKNLVNNLPDGATVVLAGGQTLQTDKPGNFKVKVNVLVGGNVVKSFDVNVKVGNNTETVPVQPTLDTTPFKTPDGKEHGVMKNSLDIAQKAGLNGAIFYYGETPVDNNEGGETPSNKEYECFMKMKNAPEVYKVKIDSNGNLCPVAEIYNVNDTSSNKRILLENNPSCINYLQAKLQAKIPQDLLGSIKIDWSENKHDYRIVSYGEGKTIEPMTIDGLWVAKKTDPDYLSDCLVLLNFTNYLTRMDGGIDTRKFKNDNPDLKLDDDGKLWVRVKSEKTTDGNGNVLKLGKRYVVPKERFGLDGISQDVLKRFIKYNNGEHWEDNWDKKKENKYYDKIALEGEAQVLGDVTPHGNDGRIPERTVATGAAIEGVGMIRFDETFVTKLGVFEDGEFKFNEGVEKTETDGSKYIEDSEGNKFKKDVENGLGYRKINGYLLMGNFKSGKLDGNGLVIAANGDTYIGKFKDGKIDGNGKRTHQIVDGPCVTLDGTFSDGKFVSGKCILGTESYNTRWDENEGKLLIVNGSETPTGYIDLTNGVVYNLGQERDIQLGEVVVAGNYLRPKNPINFGSESEELLDGKTGGLEGVGAFNGEGVFVFKNDVKETTVDGKKTITYGGVTYTGVEYTTGKGLSIQPFTGNGYQIGDSGAAKWFFIGEYNAEEKKGTGKRVFENGAVYDGMRKDTLENGTGTYTYPNGDKYEGSFVDGQFNGEGTYTWKNGCSYVGKFENDNMTEGLLKLNTGTFKVKKHAKGLVVTEGDSRGKYIDIKKGTIMDASTSPTETVEVKSYRTILDAVENGKIKDEAIKDDGKGNKYVMIGNEKYFYNIGKPTALSPYINYCIQYEDKVYFGKLNPSKGNELEGGQYVDKDGKITAVEANLTAVDEETGTHETPVVELDLSQYRNSDSKIDLSSLTTLTKAQAEILATTSGSLILDGLKTIDADIAEKLNKHEGFLSLNGIENLSKDVADKFKNRKSTMSFNSIKKFEQGVSEFIGTSEGGLSLAGLEEISNDDAKNIGNHKGIMIHENDSFNNTITLSSLKHITVEQAKLLGKFEGEIQLTGLESLDKETATELAESNLSQIYFDNPEFDKLVREIDPDKIPQYVDMGR